MSLATIAIVAVIVGVSLAGIAVAGASMGADPIAEAGGQTSDGPTDDAEIDRTLETATGETEVIVRLSDVDRAELDGTRETNVKTLQSHAERTQGPVLDRLERMDGVTVEDRWWITNAVMVTVDTDRVELDRLASIDGVTRLHRNHDIDAPEPVSVDGEAEPASGNVTYGLDQINVTQTWADFDATGQNVRVVVADTGVNASHTDIELADQNGWIDLIGDSADPVDDHGHGTHVSGTISGDNASGTAIGVAPDVELGVARVCTANAGCDGQAIMDSIQWAVDTDSDVLSMSLGGSITGDYVDPVRNAMDSGTLVVASIGNSGEGTAGSPGAVYDSLASGATNESLGVADFSGGKLIDTEGAFGSDAPADWPAEYITPDIAAPGNQVLSANAYGGSMCGDVDYCEVSGTSMSAPHKSGAAALIHSASGGGVGPYEIVDLMEETAWKPDSWNESDAQDAIDGKDTRYGSGIIDVHAASALVATDAGVEGVVTDTQGTPIEDAAVTVDGRTAETNATGAYHVRQQPGTYNVTADAFGSVAETKTVTIQNDSHVATLDFALVDTVDAEVTADQPAKIEGGENVSTSTRVANVDELVVDLEGTYDAANATLFVDGNETGFGEPISFDGYDGELEIGVITSEGTEGTLSLNATVTGSGDEMSLETGPTTVYPDLTRVGVVDDGGTYGEDVATALDTQLPGSFDSTVISSGEAIADVHAFDGYVVQHVGSANANDFVTNTSDPTVGVVYLDQWGGSANGIEAYSTETGDPANTFEAYDGTTPIRYNVETSHEILDGFGEGETVDLHNAYYPDHKWFNETDFEVLATVDNNNVTKGPALAVDADNYTVLASSLGRTGYVGNADYTADADTILANSVEYATSYEPEFYGAVAVGGNPAPEGAVVEAYVDGELRGRTVVETPGEYGSSDDPLVVNGTESDENATITFTVDGLPVAETATWSSGSVQELDLSAPGTATIDVELADNRSGGSLTESTVTATGTYGTFEATETGEGQYVFENLPADTYAVTANATGYEAETNDSVTVGVNGTTAVDVRLVGDATIEGALGDAVTGAVPANATVTVAYPDGTTTVETAPAANGTFTVENVPGTGDGYTVAATAPGYETATADVAVNESAAVEWGTVELAGNASIAGTVVDGNGTAFQNATVTATVGEGAYVDVTDGNGTYVINDVPGTGADYTVNATARGFSTNTTTVADVTGDVTGVNATIVQRSQYLGVNALTTAETVEEGDTVTVNATILNLGTDDRNDTATFRVDGAGHASRNVSLNGTDSPADAGENTTVSFTHTPDSPGNVTYAIATANETKTATVTVEESSGGGPALPPPPPSDPDPVEPALEIVEHDFSTTKIEAGETVTVESTVENAGDAAGSMTLELTVDGQPADYASVDVDPGESGVATFENTFYEPGEYELSVEGEAIGTVTVDPEEDEETGETDDGTDPNDGAADDGDGLPGFGVAVAVVALVSTALAVGRRR